MYKGQWTAGDGEDRRIVLHDNEFILGSQLNEDESTRLEVVLIASQGNTRLELRLLGWSEGIGWYAQKSLPLDRLQIRALKQILGRGEGRMTAVTPSRPLRRSTDQRRRNTPQGQSVSLYS